MSDYATLTFQLVLSVVFTGVLLTSNMTAHINRFEPKIERSGTSQSQTVHTTLLLHFYCIVFYEVYKYVMNSK